MIRTSFAIVAAAALATSAPTFATDGAALKRELGKLEQALRRPANAQTAALKARHAQLLQALYGQLTALAAVASSPTAPSFLVAPNYTTAGPCGALEYGVAGSTSSFASAPAAPILDLVQTNDVIVVGGMGSQIFDVDVSVAITHTWNSDLDITLTSPAGSVVLLSDNRGGSNDDVFNGTLFDDESANPIGTYAFANLVVAPDLQPDQSLNLTLRGEDPNGPWTLGVFDGAGGDTGTLHSWSLSVTDGSVLSIPPSLSPPATYSTGPTAIAILDNATVASPLTISGATTSITGLTVYIEVTHTWCADMLIQVQSPSGTTIDLSNHRGGSNDNVFNGTLFSMASPNLIASYSFANNVVAASLRPDGNLNLFAGEDANGTWNLLVNDSAGGDVGQILRWDLNLTAGCAAEYGTYCTAGTSLNGCVPSMSANGIPSVSAASGFVVTASGVDGVRNGQIYYGLAPSSAPFGAGLLCVAAPRQRMGTAIFTGGTAGACDGSMSADLQLFATGHPNALAIPLTAGTTLFFQCTVRDNGNLGNRVMSDAIAVTLLP